MNRHQRRALISKTRKDIKKKVQALTQDQRDALAKGIAQAPTLEAKKALVAEALGS